VSKEYRLQHQKNSLNHLAGNKFPDYGSLMGQNEKTYFGVQFYLHAIKLYIKLLKINTNLFFKGCIFAE
jgi:hypothetical protein